MAVMVNRPIPVRLATMEMSSSTRRSTIATSSRSTAPIDGLDDLPRVGVLDTVDERAPRHIAREQWQGTEGRDILPLERITVYGEAMPWVAPSPTAIRTVLS